jgi:hypothetical protein
LALEGIAVAVGWVALRRPAWDRETATRLFVTAIAGLTVVAALPTALGVQGRWARERAERRAIAAALDLAGAAPDARLMTIDPAGYRYYTGRGGVVATNDSIDTLEQIADAYKVEWLVIEADDSVPALAPVFTGEVRPRWLGQFIVEIPGPDGRTSAAIYPVCVSPVDPRCTVTAVRP